MKLILSRHYTPSTHWANWAAEDFDFSDYAQPWEHPGISPLAFETKATYGQLDLDSDAFLKSLVKELWARDFADRSGEIDDELVEMSRRLVELHEIELDIFAREAFTIDDVPLDWFRKSEFARRGCRTAKCIPRRGKRLNSLCRSLTQGWNPRVFAPVCRV